MLADMWKFTPSTKTWVLVAGNQSTITGSWTGDKVYPVIILKFDINITLTFKTSWRT